MDKYRVVMINPHTKRMETYSTEAPDYSAIERSLDVFRIAGYEIIAADKIVTAEKKETAAPRMRTAEKVLEEILREDPGSEICLYRIRQIIKTEAVPVVSCGRKKLVNVDDVKRLLAAGYSPESADGIRRIG